MRMARSDRTGRGAARVVAMVCALAAAGPAPVPAGEAGAWDAERTFLEMEQLRAEIRTLRALAGAQAALLAWNRERAESGAGPAVLPQALCAEEGLAPWCRTLVHTFGADAAAGRQGEDGDR